MKEIEESIFEQAVQFENDQVRNAFLKQACVDDPDLRQRIESLLSAYAEGAFLESPLCDLRATVDLTAVGEGPGSLVGRYKLLEQIGEGGMGIVYRAEQVEPVRRHVALKIVKPGMDSRQVISRFEAERQALALMDHPHIAKVFDAGITETGRPYFIMELVRGAPITEYCDQARLAPRRRLELFINVCQAVFHAHRKGIIHRDLKPTNILVTLHDGVPVVKVIDFGVAKAMGQRLTDKTLFTAFSQIIGTPLYMSPEQAELSGLDIDTSSDIYSLGVLLYELLTGQTPFAKEQLTKVGLDEMRRIIREEEPLRPSQRVSTLSAQDISTLSQKRGIDERRLTNSLRGELDWIVMKALEKDRTRRYESASAFATDVQRYLDDMPIEARPPSLTYRLRKFIRRRRQHLLVATVLLSALLIFAANLYSRVQSNQVRSGRAREALSAARTWMDAGNLAQAELRLVEAQAFIREAGTPADVSAEAQHLAQQLVRRREDQQEFERFIKLAVESQEKMSYSNKLNGARLAEEALDIFGIRTDPSWLTALEKRSLTSAQRERVRETAYVTLVSLADYQVRWPGGTVQNSQDLLHRASAFHSPTRAFHFVKARVDRSLGNSKAAATEEMLFRSGTGVTAWDYYLPGHTAGWDGDLDEAIRSYRAALRIDPSHYNSLFFLASRLATEKINRHAEAIQLFTGCIALRPDHIYAYFGRAKCYEKQHDNENAEADYTAAVTKASSLLDRYTTIGYRRDFFRRTGQAEKFRNEAADLVTLCEQEYTAKMRLLGPDHVEAVDSRNVLAVTYLGGDFNEKAITLLEPFLDRTKGALESDDERYLDARENFAHALKNVRRYDDAIAIWQSTLESRRRIYGPANPDTLLTLVNLAVAHLEAQQPTEAIHLLATWWEKLGSESPPFPQESREIAGFLAKAHEAVEQFEEAEHLWRGLLDSVKMDDQPSKAEIATNLALLGMNLLLQKKYDASEEVLRECVAIRAQELADDWAYFNALSLLGESLLGQQRYDEAELFLVQGYEGMKARSMQIPPSGSTRLREAAQRLMRFYEATGEPEKSESLRAKFPTDAN